MEGRELVNRLSVKLGIKSWNSGIFAIRHFVTFAGQSFVRAIFGCIQAVLSYDSVVVVVEPA